MPNDTPSNIQLIEPAIESLFERRKDSLWHVDVLNDPSITNQCSMRRKLIVRLDWLFEEIPDAAIDITSAIETECVQHEELAEIYNYLADFLDFDPLHRRIILYMPFELLPPKNWPYDKDGLQMSSDRFMRSYMRSWRELLDENDARANFFDGNVLEAELAPDGQPRVIKAAHLIPQLLKKGLLTIEEVQAIKDAATSDTLKDSIDDALSPVEKTEEKFEAFGVARLELLPFEIADELDRLNLLAAKDHAHKLPPARIAWERKNNEDLLITRYAKFVARLLMARLPIEYVLPHLEHPARSLITRLTVLRAIGMAIEQMTERTRGLAWAQAVSKRFLDRFKMKILEVPEISDELEGMFARWAYLKVVTEADVQKFGFELPKLDAGFLKTSTQANEISGYSGVIEKIAQNPEYSHLFYSVVMYFGSRLKHYAKRNADLDAAVFIRPGVSKKERPKIRRILAELFSDKKVGGKVVEFWLEEKAGGLHVRDFPNPDVFLADSTWVHLLLQSVWLGARETASELYDKLLTPFLNLQGKTFGGRDLRKVCLGEMERDVLQYRLMHKGYRRFFPTVGGIESGAENLDPTSVFWDSGYRRLATKLFLARVFLPQLNDKK